MTAVPTRRERQRQATFDEIVDVSRRLLRAGEDVSIRAVAQEMGLTPPALYRYVDSHAELLALVARSIFEDVVAAMTVARDDQAPDDPAAQVVAASAAFRAWALRNRTEFQMVFASGEPMHSDEAAKSTKLTTATTATTTTTATTGGASSLADCLPDDSGVHLFAAFFSEIFGRLWVKYQFSVPTDDELDPALLEILRSELKPDEVTQGLGSPTPGMVWMFERAWARLYGTVTLEVFGHVHPGMIATGALFTATMLDIGADLNISDEWPRLQAVARAEAERVPASA
jgi:AcrR family transcriptional regulator